MLCFGATGSGKSTLALALGERLSLPVTLVDDLCWEPGWVQPPDAELDRRVLPVLERERYVIDSVYGGHNQRAHERVNVIVALDYPRLTSLTRLARRTGRRIRARELVCNGNGNGNVETLGRSLSRDSTIAWHFPSWASKRARIRAWHADASAPPVLRLARPRDANALLRHLGRPVSEN